MEQLTAVVLAAGRGTRMKSNLPKVLHPLGGRPMMMYALDAVRRSGVAHPLLVVGTDVTPFREVAGAAPRYVVQRRPLGTGHAVAQALPRVRGRLVYVVYADMPFVSPATLRALPAAPQDRRAVREAITGAAALLSPALAAVR